MNGHLTDESFAELLAGESSPGLLAHLHDCQPCRAEAARVCGALTDFKQQSLAWAESRSAARAVPVIPRPSLWMMLPRPLLAAAAVLLACAALGGVFHKAQPAPVTQVAHQHAAGTLNDDNQLLLSIDQELNVQEPSPHDLYPSKNATSSAVSE